MTNEKTVKVKIVEKTNYFPINDMKKVNIWFLCRRWKANNIFSSLSSEEVEDLLSWHSLSGHIKPFILLNEVVLGSDSTKELIAMVLFKDDDFTLMSTNRAGTLSKGNGNHRVVLVRLLNRKITQTRKNRTFKTNALDVDPRDIYI